MNAKPVAREEIESALARAAKAIDAAGAVVLACHVNPDGDALGSMLALHHALVAAGKRSIATFPVPFVTAPHYRDTPGLELMTPPEEVAAEPELMVTFDCGSLDRLGSLRPSAEHARELVVIDHHISNERYGTINVIDPDAAASGVLVRRLIERLRLPLNRDTAVCLYTALVCDTGRFQYDSTTPDVFELARELVEFEVPVSKLSRTLFEEHRFAYLQLLGDALATATLVREQSFVWTAVTQKMLARHGVTLEEVEGLIDILRRTLEADIACVLKEEADGTVKVSLRSVGDTNVEHIASAYGGGGHRFAAGFTSHVGIEETVDRIRAAL
ncbi:MAG TPA: bifunctional oligoribonuclease/PAP phosphatase NrnA [Acidimicrobiia bacterium]|jgi:phosphoesterase RecJ-like protein